MYKLLLVFLCLFGFTGQVKAQDYLGQPDIAAMAGLTPVNGVASKKAQYHVHSKMDDGHATVLQVATDAKKNGFGAVYFTIHDRYAAFRHNFGAYTQETADASVKTGIPITAGVEWSINLPGTWFNWGYHVYIPKALPKEYTALINGLSEYATSPDTSYGSHSDWTGKKKSVALLPALVKLANDNSEPLVVCHPDIWSPSFGLYQYNPLPIATLKALRLNMVGIGAYNHEMPYGGPENILGVAAAYEAAGLKTCFFADNDGHQVPFDYPPYFPKRNERNVFFIGPENRPGYHASGIITYGKNLQVVGCWPIPNLPTKTSDLTLQVAGSTDFLYSHWSIYTDLTRRNKVASGSIPASGIIHWSIPTSLNLPGTRHRFYFIMDGLDLDSASFEPFLISSGIDVYA